MLQMIAQFDGGIFLHWETYTSNSFHIEWDMIVVTVNQMEFHFVQNQKENCHHDHIPFNVKANANSVPCLFC